jgi:hypothetical protein
VNRKHTHTLFLCPSVSLSLSSFEQQWLPPIFPRVWRKILISLTVLCSFLVVNVKQEKKTERSSIFDTPCSNYIDYFTHTHFTILILLWGKNSLIGENWLSEMSLCLTSLQSDYTVNLTRNSNPYKAKFSPEDNTTLVKHIGYININV